MVFQNSCVHFLHTDASYAYRYILFIISNFILVVEWSHPHAWTIMTVWDGMATLETSTIYF